MAIRDYREFFIPKSTNISRLLYEFFSDGSQLYCTMRNKTSILYKVFVFVGEHHKDFVSRMQWGFCASQMYNSTFSYAAKAHRKK